MKKKKTLNEIISEYHRIEASILDNEGVVDNELESILEINNIEIGEKLNGYEKFTRYLKNQVQYLKDMELQYSKKRKILEKSMEYYRDCMAKAMEVTGLSNVKTAEFSFSLNQSEKWVIDTEKINDELQTELIEKGLAENIFKPNLREIKNEFREVGDKPKWVDIVKNKFIKCK